jgi:hypothetical protein
LVLFLFFKPLALALLKEIKKKKKVAFLKIIVSQGETITPSTGVEQMG